MMILAKFVLGLVVACAATAQSPLTTTFTSNGGGGPGGQVFFDLTVHTEVTITRIDVNSGSAVGTPGALGVYVTSGTHVGNENNPSAWLLAGSGLGVAAGLDTPTPVAITNGIVLPPGSHGIAVHFLGFGFRRTSGSAMFSTAEMTLTTGSVQLQQWVGLFAPRMFNGSLHYRLGNVTGPFALASSQPYGTGCHGADLAALSEPLLGSVVTLRTTGIPAGATLHVSVLGLAAIDPGTSLVALGAPQCLQSTTLDDALLGVPSGSAFDRLLALPPDPLLSGFDVFVQSGVIATGLNPAGIATSNAIRLTLGNT